MLFVIRYVPDRYKTQEKINKVILENGGMLMFVPNCYKNQKMCNKAIANYAHVWEFVPNCYKTQKVFNKAVDTYPSAMQSFWLTLFDWYLSFCISFCCRLI